MNDQQLIERLIRIIDSAYWRLEVGDRVAALKELAQYAKPRSSFDDHWLNNKKEKNDG